jgi:hypothetical protein
MNERIGIIGVKSQIEYRLRIRQVVLLQIVVQARAGTAKVGYARVAANARAWGIKMMAEVADKRRKRGVLEKAQACKTPHR